MSISIKEQENSVKVFDLLCKIKDISFKRVEDRADLFIVTEPESELELLVDVEDDIIVLAIDIAPVSNKLPDGLAEYLLRANHASIHGAFTIGGGKLVIQFNLQAENLDLNELVAAIQSMFFLADSTISTIADFIKE